MAPAPCVPGAPRAPARPAPAYGGGHRDRRRGRWCAGRRNARRRGTIPFGRGQPQTRGMRMLFLLLVFANLAFFAYRYYLTQYAVPNFDPATKELQPDRIRSVAPEELARLAASRRGAVCIELGPLSTGDVARAEDAVAGLG